MGSSETRSVAVDCSVGSIVWVRRRNGSWWPEKILRSDELSATHLMSPRSGTPVKLLGREGASVDWYNLERSKRVKAFRCGEFDGCILRAEASLGMPLKKREKYACQEDAIIHALELERQLMEKKYGKLGYSSNGERSQSPNVVGKELVIPSEYLENGGEKESDRKSTQVGKHDVSVEEDNTSHHQDTGTAKEVYQIDSSGALFRVRGLQEFGVMTAPLDRNLPSLDASNGSLDPFSDNTMHVCPGTISLLF